MSRTARRRRNWPMTIVQEIDLLISASLKSLAADPHVKQWKAKEHNWVNYFVFRHLLQHCRPGGVLSDAAQIGIEVGVPQPKDMGFEKSSVRRDLVIWPAVGMTCWDKNWDPTCHPLAIIEWKVHRPGHRNRFGEHERKWLRSYCRLHTSVVGYAIEVDGTKQPTIIRCRRFSGAEETSDWIKL